MSIIEANRERCQKMQLRITLLICLGISMDVYASAIREGAMLEAVDRIALFRASCAFLFWQLLGMGAGRLLILLPRLQCMTREQLLIWRGVSVAAFAILGGVLIYRGLRKRSFIESRRVLTFRQAQSAAAPTGVDPFFVGIGLGAWGVQAPVLLLTVALSTLLAVFGGLYTGYRLGYEQNRTAYLLGGGALLFAAAAAGARVFL